MGTSKGKHFDLKILNSKFDVWIWPLELMMQKNLTIMNQMIQKVQSQEKKISSLVHWGDCK